MSKSSQPPFKFGICAAAVALALDQASKALAIANGENLLGGLTIFEGFDLVLYQNTGISFGLFGNVPPIVLVALASIISIVVLVLMYQSEKPSDALGFGLILGGALGNIVDRVRLGGVTDFLDFYVGEAHWPAFNLADVAIFCGAAILLLWPLIDRRHIQ